MRLLGNKTRLLDDIETCLADRGVTGGSLIDVFTGTASVARHFKRAGYRVLANDLLPSCYTQAVAALEANEPPLFRGLFRRERRTFRSVRFRRGFVGSSARHVDEELVRRTLRWLTGTPGESPPDLSSQPDLPAQLVNHFLRREVEPREGLIYRNYSPGGPHGRAYFQPHVARKIDGVAECLRDAHRNGDLDHAELHLLLSSLIDAADRRANISGTYGAYLKHWQAGTDGELDLKAPAVVASSRSGHAAFQRDANELIRELSADVLYIDPPYNKRQYAANYHVLDVIAEHHRVDDLAAYEESLYGKTGLRPYKHLRSDYCISSLARRPGPRGRNAVGAMRDLVLHADVEHVVISYNEEGLITREEMGEILAEFAGKPSFDFERGFIEIEYRRFRSDRDRDEPDSSGKTRRYRVLQGRGKDQLREWLFYARRGARSQPRGHAGARPAASRPAMSAASRTGGNGANRPTSAPASAVSSTGASTGVAASHVTSAKQASRRGGKRVLLLANPRHEDCSVAARELVVSLGERGIDVVDRGSRRVPSGVDLLIVLGGDGFLMETIRSLSYPAQPIFGVNFGSVGFLMNPKRSLESLPEMIDSEEWIPVDYPLLEARAQRASGKEAVHLAFNDITLERRSGQSIHFLASLDGAPFNNYAGDGMVVATSGGSTAYNLAAGGPVVHPQLGAMIVTPLYPHRAAPFHSMQFSLVLPLDKTLRVEGQDTDKRPVRLLVDGQSRGEIRDVEIRGSERHIRLLRDPSQPFFSVLAQKFIGEIPEE